MDRLQPSDIEALKEYHQFVRDDAADEANWNDWKTRLARRYYNRLYKDKVIVNLTRYSEGKLGLRWRTEAEVLQGKGTSICAATHCTTSYRLSIFELPFSYQENNITKQELVMAVLCSSCAKKLQRTQRCSSKDVSTKSSTSLSSSRKRSIEGESSEEGTKRKRKHGDHHEKRLEASSSERMHSTNDKSS